MTKPIFVRSIAIVLCFVLMLGTGMIAAFAQSSDTSLVNLFPMSDKSVEGAIDAKNELVESPEYQTSDYIAVSKGDTLYFGAALIQQRVHLALQNSSKQGIGTVVIGDLTIVEELGKGYAICSYQIPDNVKYVRVIAQKGVYLDGSQLVTLNQPFTAEQYFKMFNLNTVTEELGGVLYGKNVLFLGDDMTYGHLDTPSYRASQRGWVGRLERDTGMNSTNASTVSSYITLLDGRPWIGSQYLPYVQNDYDIIVIQGGVNDAISSYETGSALPVDATDEELKENSDCFIGGLQYLIRKLEQQWPNAQIVFVSSMNLAAYEKGFSGNMDAYFSPARRLCNNLGITYINLSSNRELLQKLNTADPAYFPDAFNPNADAYEIIAPFIRTELEAMMEAEEEKEPTTATTATTAPIEDDPFDTYVEETTTIVAATTTGAPNHDTQDDGGCASAAGGVSMLCVVFGMIAFVGTKKRNKEE